MASLKIGIADNKTQDPTVVENRWRFAQGEGGGGYHETVGGGKRTPNNDYRAEQERNLKRKLEERQEGSSEGVDLNLMLMRRKYKESLGD